HERHLNDPARWHTQCSIAHPMRVETRLLPHFPGLRIAPTKAITTCRGRNAVVWRSLPLVLVLLGLSESTSAQGYGLYEQGTCAMGRAGAGVASPCKAGSAIFFNPAGLALETTAIVSAEVTGVAPRGHFTNSTTSLVSSLKDRTIAVPTAYGAMP